MNAGNTPPPTERHMHPHQLPLPSHHNLILSELPEPPIPVSEIGPIPPPPMFSSPSPTMLRQQPNDLPEYDYEGNTKSKTLNISLHRGIKRDSFRNHAIIN